MLHVQAKGGGEFKKKELKIGTQGASPNPLTKMCPSAYNMQYKHDMTPF